MKIRALALASALALMATPAAAQDKLKIGFITTFTGPQGVIGEDMRASVELALEHLGGKVGGMETEVIFGDDQFKTDVGVQLARKFIEEDKVDFVMGVIWSNVLLSIYKPVTDSETFLISTNAGPSQLAGELCSPWYFNTSWQNDQTPEALGKHLQDQGANNIYAMAPNYPAGRDMVSGLKRYFKGTITGEAYTRLGQQDYQAEISHLRSVKPGAAFVFYPGGMGISFVRQYNQAGMADRVPLYSVFTVDELSIPALKDDAVGTLSTQQWVPTMDNDATRKFVADYRAKRDGKWPSYYGAQSYDGIMLVDSAVRAVNGDVSNKDALRDALRAANFTSLRGKFRFNTNHYPIQNFYLLETVKRADGEIVREIRKTVFEDHKDAYSDKCPMKW